MNTHGREEASRQLIMTAIAVVLISIMKIAHILQDCLPDWPHGFLQLVTYPLQRARLWSVTWSILDHH